MIEFPARDKMVPVNLHWYEGKKDGKKQCSRPTRRRAGDRTVARASRW